MFNPTGTTESVCTETLVGGAGTTDSACTETLVGGAGTTASGLTWTFAAALGSALAPTTRAAAKEIRVGQASPGKAGFNVRLPPS